MEEHERSETPAEPTINDSREIFGWVMYDWANSAFVTTVVTALLGPYILSLAGSSPSPLTLGGWRIQPAAVFPAAVSVSVLLQVFFLPVLGNLADFTQLKKRMLLSFAYAGAISTCLLFFVRADLWLVGTSGAVVIAGLLLIVANLCFGASVVFYNAFLPEIASPERRDAVSSKGFAVGYLGGGLLLLLNFALIALMSDKALAVRISLASAGIWWLAFTWLFPQRRLRVRRPTRRRPEGEGLIRQSLRQILTTLRELRTRYTGTLRYLIAYLIYNDGIQTVIVVATSFAAEELGVAPSHLLLLVLMIQAVAFVGALLFGRLAGWIGARRSIMLSLGIWSGAVIYAFFLLRDERQLFVLGFLIALVLGGSQALSRSLFAQMIPARHEAEYFAFYEISDRGTSWIGPLVFAGAVQITGSQRSAILSLIAFFVIGLVLL
ncbi:MAG: MFS transporter, partial [Acidobacteriota bacterium]